MLILTALEELSYSCRSKMAGIPPRRFLGIAGCTFLRTLWWIFVLGEGVGLLGCPFSVLNCVCLFLKVLLVVPLGEGRFPC